MQEIARANNHPEWEADIRKTFAKRWIDNAPKGWWYEDASRQLETEIAHQQSPPETITFCRQIKDLAMA